MTPTRLSRCLPVLLAVAGLASPVRPASAAPKVTVDRTPAVLRPGDRVRVVAQAAGADVCLLQITTPGARRSSSRVELTRARTTIAWHWRVPARTASARWTAAVRCYSRGPQEGGPVARVAAAPRVLRVFGNRATGVPRIAAGRISATVAAPASARSKDESNTGWLQIVQAIVSLCGLAGAIVGLIFVHRQLRLTREQAAADRTAAIFERIQAVDFALLWSRVGPNFLAVATVADCVARMWKHEEVPYGASRLQIDDKKDTSDHEPPMYTEVWVTANIHEEIGVLYNKNAIDREQLIRQLGSELVNRFAMAWWWVHWQRSNRLCPPVYLSSGPTEREVEFYAEWQRMATAIVEQREDLVPVPGEGRKGVVWIACLPDDVRNADLARWQAVSRELSRPLTRLGPLAQKLGIWDGTRPPHVRTGRVACFMPWPEHIAHGADLQDLASALAGKRLEELEELARL